MLILARVLLRPFINKAFFLLVVSLFVLLGGSMAHSALAAECTFATTEGTNSFTISDNWDCGHVPTNADNVTIPAAETVNVLATSEIAGLSLDGTLNVDVGIHLDINANATIGATGVINAANGADVRFLGAMVLNNGIVGTSGGMILFNNNVTNAGTFNVGSGTINSYRLTNPGTINGGTGQLWIQSFWNNTGGTFNRDTGTVRYVMTNAVNAPPGIIYNDLRIELNTLHLGSDTVVQGALLMPGGNLAIDGYDLDVSGVSTMTISSSLTSSGGDIVFHGQVTCGCHLISSGTVIFQQDVTNAGSIELGASSTFSGAVMNAAGTIQNTGATGTQLTFAGNATTTGAGVIENTLGGSTLFEGSMVSNGSLNAGSGTMLFEGYFENKGDLHLGSGIATSTQDFVDSGNVYGENGTLVLLKNWLDSGGSVYPASSTVRYRGTTLSNTRTLPDVLLNNLSIETDSLGNFGWAATSTILNDLTVATSSSFVAFNTDATLVIQGRLLNAGTFNVTDAEVTTTRSIVNTGVIYGGTSGGMITLLGDFTNQMAGSFVHQTGNFTYAGSNLPVAEMVYHNLRIRGSATYGDADASTTIMGNLSVDGGATFSVRNDGGDPANAHLVVLGSLTNAGTTHFSSGSLSMGPTVSSTGVFTNSGSLDLAAGVLNLGSSFVDSGTTLINSALVRYTGSAPSDVASLVYQDLQFVGSGPYSLTSTTTAVATTTIAAGATVAVGSNIFTVTGNLYNQGLMTTSTGGRVIHPVDLLLITDGSGVHVPSITAPGSLYVFLEDQDRNMDGTVQESIHVPFVTNPAAGSDSEFITLTETGPHSAIFRNTSPVPVRAASISSGNGFIDLTGNGLGTASYTDGGDSTSTVVTLSGVAGGGGGGGGGGGAAGSHRESTGGGGTYRLNIPDASLGALATSTLNVPPLESRPAPSSPAPRLPSPDDRPGIPFFERGEARLTLPQDTTLMPHEVSSGEVESTIAPFDRQAILTTLDLSSNEEAEERGRRGVREDAREFRVQVTDEQVDRLALFIAYGLSDASFYLGERERRAVVRDIFETRHSADIRPVDLERIVRGQVPLVRDLQIEQEQTPRVRQAFRRIFHHDPDFSNQQENLAWNALMYRLRFPRDLVSEQRGIEAYQRVIGGRPTSPLQWAMVRVLGYVQTNP